MVDIRTNRLAEDQVGRKLLFRVTPVGNRKIEFLEIKGTPGEGNASMVRVRNTRPSTQQECEMWDLLVHITAINIATDSPTAHLAGQDAYEVRDSLGNELPDPREGA